MRSSNKSRSRNKNNNNRRTNSGGNVVNRVFDSAGPEGRVRGTPQQIIEKYSSLAHDAMLSDDRVAAESFRQHAEHYSRILAAAQRQQAEQQAAQAERQAEQAAAHAQRQQQKQQQQAERAQPVETRDQPDVGEGFQPISADTPQPSENLVATPESASDAPKSRPSRQRRKPAPKPDAGESSGPVKMGAPAAE